MTTPRRDKLVELDALRGAAALIVVFGHFFEGLAYHAKAVILGTPLFFVLNGPAAVIVFFVLSGFVLTLRPLELRRAGPFASLLLKRWPRLAGPVAVAGLGFIAVAWLGGFPDPARVRTTLTTDLEAYIFWGARQGNGDAAAVLREALWGTFRHESAAHNSVLWTMHWEIAGSILAAAVAALLLLPVAWFWRAALVTGLWVWAGWESVWVIPFPLGVVGALLHLRHGSRLRLPVPVALALFAAGAVLLSWDIRVNAGMWRWTLAIDETNRIRAWMVVETIAAALWMSIALYSPTARRFLTGRFGVVAGRMSFAVYLVHLLVLLSLSSWLYVIFAPNGFTFWSGSAVLAVSLAAAIVAAAIPLMLFDHWWIGTLGRASRAMLSRRTPWATRRPAPDRGPATTR